MSEIIKYYESDLTGTGTHRKLIVDWSKLPYSPTAGSAINLHRKKRPNPFTGLTSPYQVYFMGTLRRIYYRKHKYCTTTYFVYKKEPITIQELI